MQEITSLNKLEPLKSLETRLNPLYEKDTKKYYSNLELICESINLLYQSHLHIKQIQQKRNEKILTLKENLTLSTEANYLTKKAIAYLSTLDKDFICWNDEDIENEINSMILGKVEESKN